MNYEPLIDRDLPATARAVREFCASRGEEEAWKAVARFAVLAYAPAQHAKHALICCLSAWEIRDVLGDRFEDALVACATYAAASRQPWSEPPILDPPPPDPSASLSGDRLEAERWLATHYQDDDFAATYFAAAAEDFADLGHKLIVANAAWKLAGLLGEKGRYAALRVGVWEMVAYRGEPHREGGGSVAIEQLADNMVANRGDIESAHAVFLYDAALETGQAGRVGDHLSQLPLAGDCQPSTANRQLPIYDFARDCGAYLKSHAVARRRGIERIIPAAWENLQHGPSLDSFSFA